jgi:hypothetical protein
VSKFSFGWSNGVTASVHAGFNGDETADMKTPIFLVVRFKFADHLMAVNF